jgi:hypothetical protein
MRGAAVGAAAAAAALLLAACTTTTTGRPVDSVHPGRSSSTPRSQPASSAPPPNACTSYASPDPNRPRMSLQFTIAADHSRVTGHEHLVFSPDLPISELVFRLTANTKPTVAAGSKIVVTAAKADHGGTKFRFTRANAAVSTQGGLLHIPFAKRIPAGTKVSADLDFVLTLGGAAFDRFGRTGPFAYFGSAQPLLAWERGFGWHTEDLLNFTAESATSEAMDVDLAVTAPAADTVIMSGDPSTPPAGAATRTWHSRISAARDVSVAAGPFAVADSDVGGVRLRVGAPNATLRDALVPVFRRAIVELAARFGPYPFPSLSVARLPGRGGGIEYPSSIFMVDGSRFVAVHETAHQWFYAMVGNSQALHPWLDEAFATYAEALVDHGEDDHDSLTLPAPVDASTESYGNGENRYFFITYFKGAAALFAARKAAGPAKWDAALRCYVANNAWRIANPSDLQTALAGLPAAIDELEKAGALR